VIKFDNQSKKITKNENKGVLKLTSHFDTLDQGSEASFMQWLGSDDKMSTTKNSLTLREFAENRWAIFYDNTLGHDVLIETRDGVPICKSCNSDDCGHVGFTILLQQKYENDGTLLD
jgi:hypothetical protein